MNVNRESGIPVFTIRTSKASGWITSDGQLGSSTTGLCGSFWYLVVVSIPKFSVAHTTGVFDSKDQPGCGRRRFVIVASPWKVCSGDILEWGSGY